MLPLKLAHETIFITLFLIAYLPTLHRNKSQKMFKKRNILKFPIHYYIQIFAKRGKHDKITLFLASKIGTVPLKEEQLADM